MIIRNTIWSRMFLQQWWSIADRETICDQDAFDMLYAQLLKDEARSRLDIDISPLSVVNKIKILPMDAINRYIYI